MGRVVHFEIHATEPERAIRFYQNAFGWQFERWGEPEYWLVRTGPPEEPGIDGGLIPRREEIDGEAVIAYVCTIDVESIDRATRDVTLNGGQIVVPKSAVPGVGWFVHCKDPEGNVFSMMEADETAA